MAESLIQPSEDLPTKAARVVAALLLVFGVAVVLGLLAIAWVLYDLRDGLFGGTH